MEPHNCADHFGNVIKRGIIRNPEEKDKNELKLGPKIYMLHCSLYVLYIGSTSPD
jgi:hypothetical protein